MSATTGWMVVGRIAGAFGVRGEIKVDALTDAPDRFQHLSSIFVGPHRTEYEVTGARVHGGRVLLRLAGLDTPEQVAELRGRELAIPRDQALPLEPGQYYLDDLVGMTVVTTDGTEVGRVSEVIETGSNDVFVVRHHQQEVLIPSIADAVAGIDAESRQIRIESWVLETD